MASSTRSPSAAPKSVLGSPWLFIGCKVSFSDVKGETIYGTLESAERKLGTVRLQNGSAQTVTGKDLRSVGQHVVEFTQFLNNPAHADKLAKAKREADFIGPGTEVRREDTKGSQFGMVSFHVIPPTHLHVQGYGETVHTAK